MKIYYKVTVEVDTDGYNRLIEIGHSDFQIRLNIINNIKTMFNTLITHWYRAIYGIEIVEINNKEAELLAEKY